MSQLQLTQNDIYNKLESLIGCRYSKTELNAKLSYIFGTIVSVSEYEREECIKKELPELDDQFLFPIVNVACGLSIDVDVYYIMDNGGKYYITEVNFEYN